MKRAGIIGGMGPEATLDLFKKIIKNTPAKKDQEHIPVVIDNYPQIPDRTAFLYGKGENPLPYLLESMERLEKAGVDCLCMPCNTAHYFIEELRKRTQVTFISIVEAVLSDILKSKKEYKKIGLMATDGTFIGKVYHTPFELKGLEIVDFNDKIQQSIMNSIYTLKAGDFTKAVDIFKDVFEKIVDEDYDCLIAGCTEIPILLPYIEKNKNVDIFDATESLAKHVVSFCLDQSVS
ncbi:aspartate/glutamate racemase family protein [Deferribacter autotrophicus]|uniref:Aspartate/glutamate racemase family protein n=1 Tax=Deferribacter autotrophicus TaxID=500465 RepID=A0A5A8F5C3_9BACT|nr:amino acid racemase [Deferribacter autotrophicus]KAA0256829.1 aspartate/glutamate racemase family protein [Deferribacter autotrophicus]